jgi:hypothetical protein
METCCVFFEVRTKFLTLSKLKFRSKVATSHINIKLALNTSETSVNFYQAIRRNIPEDSRCENLKSHQVSHSQTDPPNFTDKLFNDSFATIQVILCTI